MHFFDEIKDYVGFTEDDARRLAELKPQVEPFFPQIVIGFYDALMRNPRARGVFVGPEQIARLRKSLARWMGEMFEGPYDNTYVVNRRRIGEVHVNVGLLPQFMFGAMNLIRIDLIRAVASLGLGDRRADYIASVERIVDIDLTLIVQSYWDAMMQQKLQIPAALATGLAHEIRNPLNAIGLQMTLLERKLRAMEVDADVFSPVLDAMRSELRRIQNLNSEILDFARPIDINIHQLDLRQMLDELYLAHSLTLEAGNIEWKTSIEGSSTIWCDGDRFNQVLVNLLTNAVEAMRDEGGTIEITVDNGEAGMVLEFSDTGQGMPPALKYRVFDLFYTSKTSGTGVGLPIARKIIEAHGGSIDVNSRPGHGTRFTLYLPRPVVTP